MITGVAFCPQAPALVPDVGQGLDAELGPIREACRTAIRRVAPSGTQIVVVGSGEHNATFGPTSRGSFAGFGVDLVVPLGSDEDGPTDLPPSLAVGAWLVRDALGPDTGAVGCAVDNGEWQPLDLPRDDRPTALIVVGDGSAKRSEKAPGYFDERAAQFDAYLSTILGHGSGDSLNIPTPFQRHDEGMPDELMISGYWVWDRVAGPIEPFEWDAELLHDDAPFGVGYFVAAWMLRPLTPEQQARAERAAEFFERWESDPEFRRGKTIHLRG